MGDTEKFCAVANWCSYSKKVQEQHEEKPIDGLKFLFCDNGEVNEKHFACEGVRAFPTYKKYNRDHSKCNKQEGYTDYKMLSDFFSLPVEDINTC